MAAVLRRLARIVLSAALCSSLLACTLTLNNSNFKTAPATLKDALTNPEPAAPLEGSSTFSGRPQKIANGKHFVAVTANDYATAVAEQILLAGGTAIDAGVAAQMVLGLVEPQSSGIGGGGFLVYWHAASGKLLSFDGRETAPAAADGNLFVDEQGTPLSMFNAIIGGRSVGVPGLIAMLESAHAEFGKLNWSELFAPAISLAERGFEVSSRLNYLIQNVPALDVRPEIAAYLFDGSSAKKQGSLLRNQPYAEALRAIAEGGAVRFYRGDIASAIVSTVRGDRNPGSLSLEDFASYQVKKRMPVCKWIADYKFCGMGPPSSGGTTVLSILALMDRLAALGRIDVEGSIGEDTAVTHAFIESSRLAFADRYTYLADPDFVDVPVHALLSDDYINQRVAEIRIDSRIERVQAGNPIAGKSNDYTMGKSYELPSTTHLSMVDRYGNILSMTTSIETAFGSRLMTNGFLLNNQLTDFSFLPVNDKEVSVANRVEPRKRPVSSMSPMIIFDKNGRPIMAIGSPGGRSIISYVARVLYETLMLNRSVQEAVNDPHIVDTGRLRIEPNNNPVLVSELIELGHDPEVKPQPSGLHVLQRTGDGWLGVADSRREGSARAK